MSGVDNMSIAISNIQNLSNAGALTPAVCSEQVLTLRT